MKPARPAGADRAGISPLRLVGAPEASARALLDQARTAESRSHPDLARELYERALQQARGEQDAAIISIALISSARLANVAGETSAALDILDAAVASATARGSDGDAAQAASLRARILWESGDIPGAEGEAERARDWAQRAGDRVEAAALLRTLGALAVARGSI